MKEPRLTKTSLLLLLIVFVSMAGLFIGLGGLLADKAFAKPILIVSAIGMMAAFWLSDALVSFERFSLRKRKQD